MSILFLTAIEPSPNEVLAVAPDSSTKSFPLPMIKAPSVAVSAAIVSSVLSCACTSVPITTPNWFLAAAADPDIIPVGVFSMFAYSTESAVKPVKLPIPWKDPEKEPVMDALFEIGLSILICYYCMKLLLCINMLLFNYHGTI